MTNIKKDQKKHASEIMDKIVGVNNSMLDNNPKRFTTYDLTLMLISFAQTLQDNAFDIAIALQEFGIDIDDKEIQEAMAKEHLVFDGERIINDWDSCR